MNQEPHTSGGNARLRHRLFARAAATLAVCAAVLIAAAAYTLFAQPPESAHADPVGYTATATPFYRHPGTGIIEDSGGEESEVLGQSMTEGATYPYAFAEVDDSGNVYVTIRLKLMDNISDVSFWEDDNWTGDYVGQSYEVTQSNDSDNTADFRMLVADEGAVFRCSMYVVPMGRNVVFYIVLSDFAEGNPYGFYLSSSDAGTGDVPDEPVASAPSSSDTPATSGAGDAGAGTAAGSASATGEQGAASQKAPSANANAATAKNALSASKTDGETEVPSTDASVSTAAGAAEFDANGNPVDAGGGSAVGGSVSVPVSTLVVGGVGLAAIVAGLVWFLAFYRPKHEGAFSSAAAAAAQGEGGPFRPYAAMAVLPKDEAAPESAAPDGAASDATAPLAPKAPVASKDGSHE